MKQLDYGIDAPNVIRNLSIAGLLFIPLTFFLPSVNISGFIFPLGTITIFYAIIFFLSAALMLFYAKKGKFTHRDRILNLINWKGNEQMLDVGTGLGLLMNGAAKRLTTGKAIGIDIWNKADLSNNNAERAAQNAGLEGVADKIEIKNENITTTSFPDNYFDVVVSNLCLHNIYNPEGRQKACKEIHRILKQNGTAIISDFKHTGAYKTEFLKSGMTTEKIGTYYFDTFPPLTIIKAIKN